MTRIAQIRARLDEKDNRGETTWHEHGCPAVPPAVGDCCCIRSDLEHLLGAFDASKRVATKLMQSQGTHAATVAINKGHHTLIITTPERGIEEIEVPLSVRGERGTFMEATRCAIEEVQNNLQATVLVCRDGKAIAEYSQPRESARL